MKSNICVLPDFEPRYETFIPELTAFSETFDRGQPALRSVDCSFNEGENLFAKEGSASDTQYSFSTIVHRVSRRVAIGIPLDIVLACEGLTCEEYKKQLKAHPELATLQAKARCEFLERCLHTLLSAKDPSVNIRWLLERIYPDIFGNQRPKASQ